eukprot:scaffold20660_cov48-Phaeocystis_antarctica.AAC.1
MTKQDLAVHLTPDFTPLPPEFPARSAGFPIALEAQLEAAAGGRFEGLLGGVVEVVAPQTATGRCTWERARAHATH